MGSSESNAWLDIAANSFWGGRFEYSNSFWGGRFEYSFFDVRVFNPGAPSNHPFKSAYHCHEREKRCQYEQRVREVEHGHFTPLVFITTGGMGDAAGQVYKRLPNLLTEKLDLSYGEVMGWIRCKLSFALVRSAIMCIRGARSRLHSPVFDAPLDVRLLKLTFSQFTLL